MRERRGPEFSRGSCGGWRVMFRGSVVTSEPDEGREASGRRRLWDRAGNEGDEGSPGIAETDRGGLNFQAFGTMTIDDNL